MSKKSKTIAGQTGERAEAFSGFRKRIEPSGARGLIIFGIVLFILGILAYGDQFMNGLGTSAMNNLFTWGLVIAVFAFLVGFGAGGQLMASILAFRDGRPSRLCTISSIIGTFAGIGAGIAIMVDLGNPLNIMAMVMNPNPTSPLTWDMLSLSLFIVLSIIMSYIVASPWAYESGHDFLHHWTRKYASREEVENKVRVPMKIFAVLGFLAAVLLQVVEGLIFAAPAAHAWWHSILVPVDFLAVAFACGSSLIAGIAAVTTGKNGLDSDWDSVDRCARMAGVFIIIHLVLAFAELFSQIFVGGETGQLVLGELGAYWPLYVAELALPLAAAVLFLRKRKNYATGGYVAGGILVIIGIFCHRLMLLYPAFNVVGLTDGYTASGSLWEYPVSSGLTGGADGFITSAAYWPTLGEWGVAALAVGLVVILAGWVCGYIRLLGDPKKQRR